MALLLENDTPNLRQYNVNIYTYIYGQLSHKGKLTCRYGSENGTSLPTFHRKLEFVVADI